MKSQSVTAGAAWDSPGIHAILAKLTIARSQFRMTRLMQRLRSPRRIIATTLAVTFFVLYLLNGIFILSARTPADPARLKLWLSGGMVIYALYHFVRCVWTQKVADLELSRAEELWLGGGPVRRSSLAVYHIGNILIAALIKTGLIAVVLTCDVTRVEFLFIGLFSSLVLLEIVRLTIQRWSSGLSSRSRVGMRIGATAIAAAVGLQVIARVMAAIDMGSPTWKYVIGGFSAIGDTASCKAIQVLALPWMAASRLVVGEGYQWMSIAQMLIAIAMIPLSILLLVRVDAWARDSRHRREQARLKSGNYQREPKANQLSQMQSPRGQRLAAIVDAKLPPILRDAYSLMARQAVTINRYRSTIVFSFVVPTLLCLSPLVTGQVVSQWFYVVGGIAMCTMLLAPPALRIDFRRDLRRMMLLRSLPVRPLSMVLGQLSLPILITIAFQFFTIAVAAMVTQPGIGQTVMWAGILSALAVFTFAAENALFLTYPHHERAEGIGMMVRAKLTFLGKVAVLAGAITLLFGWAVFCTAFLPETFKTIAFVSGAVLTTWTIAAVSIAIATWCWQRFDLSFDVPPE